MAQLTEELTSTENKIAFARQAYNDSVMTYNTKREGFPDNIIAGMFNFNEAQLTRSPKRPNARRWSVLSEADAGQTETDLGRMPPLLQVLTPAIHPNGLFDAQEQARKHTVKVVILFALAVLAIALAIYAVIPRAVFPAGENKPQNRASAFGNPAYPWRPGVGLLVSICRPLKFLNSSPAAVTSPARSVVVSSIPHQDGRAQIAERGGGDGLPGPHARGVHHGRRGHQRFCRRFQPADAAIAITRGCIRSLTRDELQGVVAHKFSHILNGDMRMNIASWVCSSAFW